MEFESEFKERTKRQKIRRIELKVISWILVIAIAIAAGYFFVYFFLEKASVYDSSMNPALSSGDKLLIEKLSYKISDPERYDVIVFKQGKGEHEFTNVKRIIGLPGETVKIVDGKVYINGSVLDEEINTEYIAVPGTAAVNILLEENEYFVLGDNRNESVDSRSADVGNIVRDDIIGKALFRLNNFSIVSSLNKKSE